MLTFQGIPQILDLLFDFPSAISGGEENIIRILALFFQLRLHAIEAKRFPQTCDNTGAILSQFTATFYSWHRCEVVEVRLRTYVHLQDLQPAVGVA
jgi:hypothetical protein